LISCGAALLIPYLNLFFSHKFDIGDDLLGSIFTALGLTAGLAALAGPALSIRIGKMQTIVLAQLLSLPFLLLVGFAPLLAVAVGAALVRQMLFNMGSPLYDAYAMEHTPEALRPTVIGGINGAFAAGYLVMPVVSTIIQEQQGFAPLFLMTGTFYLLAVFANYWLFVRGSGGERAMALYRT
jgi:MFS family permease